MSEACGRQTLSRTARLIGDASLDALARSHVAVLGVGGVGGHCAEALARAGVGRLTLIDGDVVTATNLNRQLVALTSTLGRPKVHALRERLLDIRPDMRADAVYDTYRPDNAQTVLPECDCVIDAIDDVGAKIHLAMLCAERGVFEIASMGAGNKLDATRFRVMDLFETREDPLARVLRRELRKRGLARLCVVCSDEKPRDVAPAQDGPGRRAPASISFVPPVAGLIIAGHAVRYLIGDID